MILRLSHKLNSKFKAGKLTEMPLDENPYADWSCHLFTADRTQYIILMNTASLYSCVAVPQFFQAGQSKTSGVSSDSMFICTEVECRNRRMVAATRGTQQVTT